MTPDVDSPTGLDLHPQLPAAVRVRKSVGVIVMVAIVVVGMLIVYGVYERRDRQIQASFIRERDRKATPATAAGHEISAAIPRGDVPILKPQATPQNEKRAEPEGEKTVAAGSPRPAVSPPTRRGSFEVSPPRLQYQSTVEQTPDSERDLAFQKEQEAIEAPTRIGGAGKSSFSNNGASYAMSPPALSNPAPQLVIRPEAGGIVGDSRAGLAGIGQAAEYNAQNGQDQKAAFLTQARNRAPQNYLQSSRLAPLSKFEIKAGWDIPATLEQAINSDQPGEIKALVRENVFDTATGKYILIPQGARLIGSYSSIIAYGQDGVQAVWDRIIFPDASSINLNGMIGQDAKGEAGLRYAVDHHYTRLLGFAVLTSLFSAGYELSRNRTGTILAVPSTGEIIGSAVGGQVSQLGMEITRRNLNVQPTIKVPAGYRFNVRVNRDIVFDSPY